MGWFVLIALWTKALGDEAVFDRVQVGPEWKWAMLILFPMEFLILGVFCASMTVECAH